MSAPEQPGGIDIAEVLAELDDIGRTKWELAVARVENKHLRRRLAAAENESAPTEPKPESGAVTEKGAL